MQTTPEAFQQSAEARRLSALWDEAAIAIEQAPGQQAAQALGAGVNFRVNILKGFQAAWETAQAAAKLTAALHAPFDPIAWLEVGAEVVGAIQTVFSSLVQKMLPIEYVTAVILSTHPEGLTRSDLQKAVVDFLDKPEAFHFAWYLGMNQERITRAKRASERSNWIDTTLDVLRRQGFLEEDHDKLKFKSKNYTVGWEAD